MEYGIPAKRLGRIKIPHGAFSAYKFIRPASTAHPTKIFPAKTRARPHTPPRIVRAASGHVARTHARRRPIGWLHVVLEARVVVPNAAISRAPRAFQPHARLIPKTPRREASKTALVSGTHPPQHPPLYLAHDEPTKITVDFESYCGSNSILSIKSQE